MNASRDSGPESTRAQALRDHLRGRPDDGAAWLALARVLARRPPGPELYHALEQAIRSRPEDPETWTLAAAVQQLQHGPDAALRWLEQSAHQNPALSAPRTAIAAWRGDRLRQEGQWREALAAYREVEKSQDSDPVLLNNIGSCLASMERYEEAGRYFERALELRPEFAEARLNAGFLSACRGRDEDALDRLGGLLADRELAPATRHAAATIAAILQEHRRLRPTVDETLRSGRIDPLQAALLETPAGLSRAHDATIDRLQRLAGALQNVGPEPPPQPGAAAAGPLRALEAFTQCNLEGGAGALADLWREWTEAPGEPTAHAGSRRFHSMMALIADRAGRDPAQLQTTAGEAWLRYWHARLLAGEPQKRPGQYKLAANAIKGLPLTPPDRVAGTFRRLLTDILPTVPPGLPRGLLLLTAINMIHGFGDGNGRLARFLLAWETEFHGGAPLLIPVDARAAIASALDDAWLDADPLPLFEAAGQAQALALPLLAAVPSCAGPERS